MRQHTLTIAVRVTSALALLVGLSACSKTAARQVSSSTGAVTANCADFGTCSNPYPWPTPTNTSGSNSGGTNLDPPFSESFSLFGDRNGYAANTFTTTTAYRTDNIFKVRVTPEQGGRVYNTNNNFAAMYGCVSYTIRVYDTNGIVNNTVTTPLIKVGAGSSACANADTKWEKNYSGLLTVGVGDLKVEVSKVKYDFYCTGCQGMPWYYNPSTWYTTYNVQTTCSLFCPAYPLAWQHQVNGTLVIGTNGTTF